MQGGLAARYGIFYLGIWGSTVDFGRAATPSGKTVEVADVEIDWYGGARKTWRGLDWGLGAYYSSYPGAFAENLDYLELHVRLSKTIFDKLTIKLTDFWSPNYSGDVGPVDVVELAADYTFDTWWIFDPSVSALVGGQFGREDVEDLNYAYWNAGLTLGLHRWPAFSLDLRFWDTNLSACAQASVFQCGERLVGSFNAEF